MAVVLRPHARRVPVRRTVPRTSATSPHARDHETRCSPRRPNAARQRRQTSVRPCRRPDAPTLLPLRYYEIDPSYNVPAALRALRRPSGVRDADLHRHAAPDGARRRARVHVERAADDAGGLRARRHPAHRIRSSSRSPIRRRAPRPTRRDDTWTCIRHQPASTRSISTAPTTRTARTTTRTSVRSRRRRTG